MNINLHNDILLSSITHKLVMHNKDKWCEYFDVHFPFSKERSPKGGSFIIWKL